MDFTGERVVPGKVNDDLMNEHLVRYKFAEQFIQKGSRVLDAGCGTGYGTARLAAINAHAHVLGVDISEEAVNYALGIYSRENCSFAVMDLQRAPLTPQSLDLVTCFEVIEHIEKPEEFLAAVSSALKVNGNLIVSTPNRRMYSDAVPEYHNPYHVKEYYLNEFETLLKEYFSHVTLYSQDFLQGMVVRPVGHSVTEGNPKCVEWAFIGEGSQVNVEESSFFVAVCSGKEIRSRPPLICTFSESNIIAEKDRFITRLKHEVLIRDESVKALQSDVNRQSENLERIGEALEQRDQVINALQIESRERGKWIESLQEEVVNRDIAIEALQRGNKVQVEWIDKLQEEVRKRDESVVQLLALLEAKKEPDDKLS